MIPGETAKFNARPSQGRRWHYAWIVVAVTFATLLVGAGVRTAPGVLIRPLEQDFGWDRASISLAVAIGIFIFGLTGPLAGALLDRFGPRRVMLAGASLTVLGLAPLLAMREIWELYVFMGLVTGLGTGAVSGSLGAVVAARWFKTHRGIVIGIFGGATSMGQLIFIPSLLGLTTASGWRSAVGLMIVAGVALLAPIFLLMRNYPAEKGLLPFGDNGTAHPEAAGTEQGRKTSVRVALRGREFWLLAGSYFICGYTSAGLITTHLIPYSLEHGFDEATTAGTMALMGAMNLVGTLSSGWLTDRYDNRRLLAVYFSTRAVSLVALPFIINTPQLLLFAVVYGFDWVATVPPIVNLTATTYGKGSLGVIYGWIFFAHMLGASIAAYAGGYLRESLGDYNAVFAGAALMALIAVGFSLGIRLPGLRQAEPGSLPA